MKANSPLKKQGNPAINTIGVDQTLCSKKFLPVKISTNKGEYENIYPSGYNIVLVILNPCLVVALGAFLRVILKILQYVTMLNTKVTTKGAKTWKNLMIFIGLSLKSCFTYCQQ